MDVAKIKEGARVSYKARVHSGTGKVTQVYRSPGGGPGWWVIVHDKDRNVSVTVRPSQVERLR